MKIQRKELLIDPPSMAAPDIAFTLIVFFLVCASVQPDTGRSQEIPRSEKSAPETSPSRSIEVSVAAGGIVINGEIVPADAVVAKVSSLLRVIDDPEGRIVVVSSSPDTPYSRWISVTGDIEAAGGIITLQLEENQTITVD